MQASPGAKIPTDAVKLSKENALNPIFVGSAIHEGTRMLARICSSRKTAYIHFDGMEVEKHFFKV